jgi:LSD1 subclass zinc finger protein
VQAVLTSNITCPECGTAASAEMPTDARIYLYECTGCKTLLQALPGDRCVFCSFGDVSCPPVQLDEVCCGSNAANDV